MKPAFSTVACPEWTLEQVAAAAGSIGALGVELRTFGDGANQIACDPFLTAPGKTSALFDEQGVEVACLATSVRFDRPIDPPILGHVLGDNDRSVREARSAVRLAEKLLSPFVRVFAFELPNGESRGRGMNRIVDRLSLATATARNTEVRILIENGGSFCTAADLAEIMDRVNSPLLQAAYSLPVAIAAGEDPDNGFNVLGERLASVKLKALDGGAPCALGLGDEHLTGQQRAAIRRLALVRYTGWVVFEHDRAWLASTPAGDDAPAAPEVLDVLRDSMQTLYGWIGTGSVGGIDSGRANRGGVAWKATATTG